MQILETYIKYAISDFLGVSPRSVYFKQQFR